MFVLSVSQKASGVAAVPGSDDARKKVVLELRRVLILALVGATPKSNPSLDPILEAGYLQEVNRWLDDILSGSVGTYSFNFVRILASFWLYEAHRSIFLQVVLICCFIF